jgi:Flp pilus assembly protein TadG
MRDDRGVALVEFTLVAPLLMLLLFGMLDFGKALNYWLDETHLANMGARMAVVENWPTRDDPQTLQEYIREQADTGELKDNVVVCVEVDPDAGPTEGTPLTVRVRMPTDELWTNFIVNMLDFGPDFIRAHSTMRLEKDTRNYELDNDPSDCP